MKTLLALCLLALAGCATLRSDETVCPEYRDLRCLTAPECSLDRTRGCRVCQCRKVDAAPAKEDGRLPSNLPPDQVVKP
ncbi:hypothetical protein [Anaeromyxobacter paludicola]|uniref:Lipoprotein n=1 Tax=Anaeromyxobacter paludicola TaxID=2918171 RepID=A0ABM7XFH2_9BACT|nr:hypothetical protein [Anaeromyxobacter paludicola]BDG10593.1 hypothetical protein AMPC_37060 [Anaeromyxobacter paludicola]